METRARPSELRRPKWTEVKEDRFVIKRHKAAKKVGIVLAVVEADRQGGPAEIEAQQHDH